MCIWKVSVRDRHCEYCTVVGCERHAMRLKDRKANRYVKAMSDIVGENILQKSRRKELVWARNMVAFRLRRDGYSLCRVANILEIDHSTIVHCEKRVKDMLKSPSMYRNEFEIWEKFVNSQK